MNKYFKNILSLLLVLNISLSAQEQFRVMTYNLLNYPSKISSTRNPYFKTVVSEVDPDIIITQEVESLSGVVLFQNQVLDTNYTSGGYVSSSYTSSAMFFKHSKFNFISVNPISTDLRDIVEMTMEYKATKDTLIIYAVHLKASDGTTNEQKRLSEVNNLRAVTDQLPLGAKYIVAGDFNIYNSYELAFNALLDQTNSGYFLDPLNSFGYWHNNENYRGIHTQATRTEELSDGGVTGGLDDRFDMILISQSVSDSGGITYVDRSYKVFGNDGNHFNKAMNELPNAKVADSVALALYYASDHLPVYADFEIQNLTSVSANLQVYNEFELEQNYPNPFNPITTIKYTIPYAGSNYHSIHQNFKLNIYDVLGKEIAVLVNEQKSPGTYEVTFDASDLSSGVYYYQIRLGDFIKTKKMILLK